jgi:CDGSH-type Zn-finger protein
MKKTVNKKKKNGRIVITKNGSYAVSGGLPLAKEIIITGDDGNPVEWKKREKYPNQENYLLCRCGQSGNKPYCDQTHIAVKFNGTETASKKKYLEQANEITGPKLVLRDCEELCATARFCHRAGGAWKLAEHSDDLKSREIAIEEACDCPSGRLVACDRKTGSQIEPSLKREISLVEDPEKKVSGPIWVKGGIPIESSDGSLYETRNRVTLCRCGFSHNKPFCDGTHIDVGFTDEDKNQAGKFKTDRK